MVAVPSAPPAPIGWADLLALLTPTLRTVISDNAAFLGVQQGKAILAVRSELWRDQVIEAFRPIDLSRCSEDLRLLDVVIDPGLGRTGREVGAAEDAQRQAAAEAAAQESALLQAVCAAFDARILHVEPPPATGNDTQPAREDSPDE